MNIVGKIAECQEKLLQALIFLENTPIEWYADIFDLETVTEEQIMKFAMFTAKYTNLLKQKGEIQADENEYYIREGVEND